MLISSRPGEGPNQLAPQGITTAATCATVG
jgi:hypothetical protein